MRTFHLPAAAPAQEPEPAVSVEDNHHLDLAWAELRERLVREMRAKGASLEEAEEVVHEAIVNIGMAHEGVFDCPADKVAYLHPWLYIAATHKLIDLRRQARRRPTASLRDADGLADETPHASIRLLDFDRAGRAVYGADWPAKRDLLVAHALGEPPEQIAADRFDRGFSTFITRRTVTSEVHRISTRIRDHLKQ